MKRWLTILGLATLVALLHTGLFLLPWGEALELRFLDLWFNIRGPVAPPEDVVIVAMDEESYDHFGISLNQAWPRALHAKLLRRLADCDAKRVVFDVLFLGDGPDATADRELAEAMRGVPTIIGADVGELKGRQSSEERTLLLPGEKFREAANLGLVGVRKQSGHARRFFLPDSLTVHDMADQLPPSLAVAASGVTNQPGARDLIRFYGPRWSVQTCAYEQVLDPDKPVPAEAFRSKIVFVGFNQKTELGAAQKDSYLTPFTQNGETFGVEIHATATANLLQRDWIKRRSSAAEASGLALLAALVALALLLLRPTWGALLLAGYGAGWGLTAYALFLRGWFLPGATLAVIVLPFTYLGSTLTNYLSARLKQLRLQRAFQQYLSPEMAREISQNPDALRLGGEEVECTAMFTDIAGFTTIVEKMKPGEVSRMLNAYFTEVMDAVFDQRGTMIQFIGDGVYALWGAPIKTAEHARLCVQAALEVQTAIDRFNQSGRFPPLHTRFGINTGPVLVGNLGSVRRFDFTGIGDTVNLASRLEGLNKQFGTTILMTDNSHAMLPAGFHSLKLGLIRAVGKTLPVGLFTVFHEPVSPETTAEWEEACERFVARDWSAAGELFATTATQDKRLAKAADLYRRQIELHQSKSPPPEWQGEISFTSK